MERSFQSCKRGESIPLNLREKNKEIGIMSSYRATDGRRKHLLFADLAGKDADIKEQVYSMSLYFQCEYALLNSGNSYHVYLFRAMNEDKWRRNFLSYLLLGTEPVQNRKKLNVDVRWVGHTLHNGFGCLRGSSLTGRYKQSPTVVDSSLR